MCTFGAIHEPDVAIAPFWHTHRCRRSNRRGGAASKILANLPRSANFAVIYGRGSRSEEELADSKHTGVIVLSWDTQVSMCRAFNEIQQVLTCRFETSVGHQVVNKPRSTKRQ